MDLWSYSVLLLGDRNFHCVWWHWNMFIPIVASSSEVCLLYLQQFKYIWLVFRAFFFKCIKYNINICLQNGCTVLKHSSSRFSYIHYCVSYSSISHIQYTLDTYNRQITFLAFPKFNRRCRLLCFILANLYSMYTHS